MLKFYFNGAPNPNKVALFLEESGLPYELVPVDTRKGDQFKPEFLKVNPNGKVPAIDDDGVFVFDSNAILLYLAEKTGKFLPPNTPKSRAQLLSWLMFIYLHDRRYGVLGLGAARAIRARRRGLRQISQCKAAGR